MIVDARETRSPGVVIDTGTGKRIPFVRKADFETGEYEALAVAPNGVDYLADEDGKVVVVRGRAVGKLELVPLERAKDLGRKPVKVESPIEPMTADEKREGLDQYRRTYFDVWRWRGEADRCVHSRWEEFLQQNDFLDCFVLKRTFNAEGTAKR